ncbi:unnamed protein product [Paramecium pentaurelia]|uniref:Uncharacterized protein n=1 Tax=Paramecium pentaurelia TaxID=43138 RepID=A0A8S1XQH5_9CILI|nr:unnamed protein product [Paramecium pentaurelia]
MLKCLLNRNKFNTLFMFNLVQQWYKYAKSIQLNKIKIKVNQNTYLQQIKIQLSLKMIVELGDQKVYGVIKQLEEAKKEYKKGIEDGKIMVISQGDQDISNIKKVKIGCQRPDTSLKIQFEYIQPLQVSLNQF